MGLSWWNVWLAYGRAWAQAAEPQNQGIQVGGRGRDIRNLRSSLTIQQVQMQDLKTERRLHFIITLYYNTEVCPPRLLGDCVRLCSTHTPCLTTDSEHLSQGTETVSQAHLSLGWLSQMCQRTQLTGTVHTGFCTHKIEI